MVTIPRQTLKKTSELVIVKRGWLRSDAYFSENDGDVTSVTDQDTGILKIVVKEGENVVLIKVYNQRDWKTLTVRRVRSRAVV